jgi:PKD repeat protein
VTVGSGASSIQIAAGTSLTISATAADSDADLLEHWLEIQNPSGQWSWQGWLTAEPWAGALQGNSSTSTKTAEYTFAQPGTYHVRSTATDAASGGEWMISNTVEITVTPASGASTSASTSTSTSISSIVGNVTDSITSNVSLPVSSLFNSDGSVNRTAYVEQLAQWSRDAVDRALGPTFEQLNPGAADDRPTNYRPASRECSTSYVNKINPFELGPPEGCSPDNDYWSESGQVAYVPDDPANDPGLDRIQTFAYYDNVFALSPRLDWTGLPHPDPQTMDPNYVSMLGGRPAKFPIATIRNYGMLSNEALVLYRDGLLGVAGTQTSRDWWERPYPGILFPSNKVPTALALTTNNEFALVTVWDTNTLRGQLAVIALEAKWLPFHTMPYMCMPNQGSWSDMKLLGYIDLPMAAPSSVAATSNGWWAGPSQTGGLVLSQIDLTAENVRQSFTGSDTQWSMLIADKGYAVVASKADNKAVILDLSSLFQYVRQSYLSSAASFSQTVNNRGNGSWQWPLTFDEKPDLKPRIVWEKTLAAPTAVLAGLRLDRWSPDRHKAYVAQEDGTIHIVDTSPLMARYAWEKVGSIGEIGTVKVGRNPVSMAFTRFIDSNVPLLPSGTRPDPLNNTFYVACRGDREVDAVVTYEGQGAVYRKIKDIRMGDPVSVSVSSRGNIVTVADYKGRKIMSYRVGAMYDRQGRFYGPGPDGKSDYEYTGELYLNGNPVSLCTTNVN